MLNWYSFLDFSACKPSLCLVSSNLISAVSRAILAWDVLAFLPKLLKIGTFKLTPISEESNHCWLPLKKANVSEKACLP